MLESGTDRWIKCISTQGNIRGVAIQATQLLDTMAATHQLKGLPAKSLGEAVLGALLLASHCKPGERLNLNIQGKGHIRQALVDAYPDATVRGYVIEQTLTQEQQNDLHRDGLGPWGTGLLSVLKAKTEPGSQPYIGTVPLITGHLAKDLTFYWLQSEQIPSAVGIAVSLNDEGDIESAGGFLIQALPGASAEEVKSIERHIRDIHSLEGEISKHESPMHLLSRIFEDTAFIIVEEKTITFQCNCSSERVERALGLIGAEELQAIVREQSEAIVKCDFCATEYRLDIEAIERIIAGITPDET